MLPPLFPSVADLLEHLLAEHDTPALAVGITVLDEGIDLAVHPLAHHPVDELIGFEAPAAWHAFGLAARGRTVPWGEASEDPAADARRGPAPGTPVQVIHLVDRDEAQHTRLLDDQGEVVDLSTTPEGLVADLCRRVLGLPTAPPPTSPLRYWAGRWLADVLDHAGTGAVGAGWASVAACHPAVRAVADLDGELGAVAADHLVSAGEALATAQPWEALHRHWSSSAGGHAGLSPTEVAWMDAGMLARWCLSLLPELDDLLGAVEAVLPTAVAGRVRATIEAWDLTTEATLVP